jgi:hypothetical protein
MSKNSAILRSEVLRPVGGAVESSWRSQVSRLCEEQVDEEYGVRTRTRTKIIIIISQRCISNAIN